MEFPGVTKFYGTSRARDGGWIGKQNTLRKESGKPELNADDFIIEHSSRLLDGFNVEQLIEIAIEDIDFTVGRIKKVMDAEDYKLIIGGEGNYRYDCAQVLPYIGNRGDNPLHFQDVREAFKKKYKTKVRVADGIEAEDMVGHYAHNSYLTFKETGLWDVVIAYIDKDLKQFYCPRFNYDDTGAGIEIPEPRDCMEKFCIQLLIGDRATDNIPGLPQLSPELAEKYKLRKTKGLGETTAKKLVAGKSIKEMFEIVVEAYKAHFGEEKKPFETHRGETVMWNWLDYLQDTAILIYLQRREGEMYNIEDTLKKLKINY